MLTPVQVKLSDLATCSPSSTLRLDMVDKNSEETDVAGLPCRNSASTEEVPAAVSDDFIRIRRVSVYLRVLVTLFEETKLLARFYDVLSRPRTNFKLSFC